MVGLLRKAVCGTREAPQSWQMHVTEILHSLGFKAGKANPCVFRHEGRDLAVTVHVDDFLVAGLPQDLKWLKEGFDEHFESKSVILGDGPGEVKSAKYPGRILNWGPDGISYEHDPRHVETILIDLGMIDCNGVDKPGVKDAPSDDDPKLSSGESTKMRKVIATMNYISKDRMDLGYAVKECTRGMSSPTERTVRLVKRVGRHLRKHPRMINFYKWQEEPSGFVTYTGSDWAGCVATRRSASGGIIMRDSHVIKHWSRTQSGIALSSGEAELYALVKGSAETIGAKQLAAEMMLTQTGTLCPDSSAAKGTVSRIGSGRLKHIVANHLRVQEKCADGRLVYRKVPRGVNPSDCLTHYWESASALRHFAIYSVSQQRSV